MLTKNLVVLAVAAMATGAVAINPHRHGHDHQHEKKDLKYQTQYTTVTDWVTVTVNGAAPSTTSTKFVAAGHSMTRTRTRKYSKVTSSSSSLVVPSSTEVKAAASTSSTSSSTTSTPTTSSSVQVVVHPTTLVSSTKNENVYVAPPAAATPTTTSQAAPKSTPVTASSGNKRGLAYNDPSLLAGFVGQGSKVSWTYNWGQTKDNTLDHEFVPMLWGPGDNHAKNWNANANKAIAAGSKCLLSFNEPDHAGQSNLSPAAAAEAHIRLMNPFAGKARIGAPAVTNSGSPGQGLNWLKDFLTACNGNCAIDFVPVHWYSNNGKDFLSHLQRVKAVVGNLPVWVTEFAPFANEVDYNQFLVDSMTAIDNDPQYSFVERYSYFMVAEGMLTAGKQPSKLGNTFAYA